MLRQQKQHVKMSSIMLNVSEILRNVSELIVSMNKLTAKSKNKKRIAKCKSREELYEFEKFELASWSLKNAINTKKIIAKQSKKKIVEEIFEFLNNSESESESECNSESDSDSD